MLHGASSVLACPTFPITSRPTLDAEFVGTATRKGLASCSWQLRMVRPEWTAPGLTWIKSDARRSAD